MTSHATLSLQTQDSKRRCDDDPGHPRGLACWRSRSHYAWVQENVDSAKFEPGDDKGDDYNVWHLDMDVTPDQESELAERIGEVDFTSADLKGDDEEE